MNQFPLMMYKHGGPEQIHGGQFSTLIVQDGDERDAALAKGWHMTTPEAAEAAKDAVKGDSTSASTGMGAGTSQADNQQDNAPPTRDEMKAKATQLGLTYPHNISNIKLAELIDAALAKG